jgi:hypothetical protein
MTVPRGESVGDDQIRVLLVGTGDDFGTELEGEDFEVARIPDLASLGPGSDQDAVIVALDEPGPLEALETLRLKTPAAAVLVLTTQEREADGRRAPRRRGGSPHPRLDRRRPAPPRDPLRGRQTTTAP